jgi:hypothetical protein
MALDFPSSPTNGQIYNGYYYDTASASWRSSPLTNGPAYISDTVPAAAPNGGMWYNSADGTLFIKYNDSWVEARSNPKIIPGSIVQVVQTVKTDAFASSAGAVWGDIPGMSASITPKFANSRIMIMVDVKAAGTNDNSICRIKIQRSLAGGSYSDVYIGNGASNRPRAMSEFYMASGGGPYYMAQMGGTYLDDATSAASVTYKLQIGGDGTGNTLYVNRTQGDRDNAYYDARGASSITLMEVAQ